MPDPTFTTPPSAPARSSPSTFSALTDPFLAWFSTFKTELDTAVTWFNSSVTSASTDAATAGTKATEASTSAAAASTSAGEAAASATEASGYATVSLTAGAAAAGASIWVSGGNYTATTSAVVSPTDHQTYRAITTHSGVTTDPQSDAVNWVRISGDREVSTEVEARAGANNLKGMTPLRTFQAIEERELWIAKTSAYTAVSGDQVIADTSGGAFTVTLPATPATGAAVWFTDPGSNWSTNNLTVGGNGKNIDGSSSFTADVDQDGFALIYNGTQWVVRLEADAREVASQAEAEAGTDNIKGMTPLRVAQALSALGGGGTPELVSFTTSGTWVPDATSSYLVFVTGAGGDKGSGYAGGGGAGATAIGIVSGSVGSQTVTIGAANGGQSSLGSRLVAGGGSSASGSAGGAGGASLSGTDLNVSISGGDGETMSNGSSSGGSSFWGSYPAPGTGRHGTDGSANGKDGIVVILKLK